MREAPRRRADPPVAPARSMRPSRRSVLAGIAAIGAGAACSRAASVEDAWWAPPYPTSTTRPPTTASSAPVTGIPVRTVVARAETDIVAVFDSVAAAEASRTLDRREETSGELVFVVEAVADGGNPANARHRVQLPVRPNGSVGWVATEDVSLSQHGYAIEIELAEHRLTLYQDGQAVESVPVGVGTESTPTPGGTYYIKELLRPPDPTGAYGPYAYGLSGFSNVLTSFAGGDGVIGIHGTNEPDRLGSDVSHGCIRVHNEVITALVDEGLPLGTPVIIQP